MSSESLKKYLAVTTAIAVVVFCTRPAFAQMMDPDSRNLLINKFEQVLIGLAPSDSSYTSVTLRLADLCSERARYDVMKELEKGCIECNAGIADRKKALKLYESVLPQVAPEAQGKIVIQIGHLNEQLGQTAKAEQTYLNIIKDNKSAALVAESRAALGEMYFKQRIFPQARVQFEEARKGQLAQQGLAAYRISWCLFNEGKIADAVVELKNILKSPQLLTRSGSSGVVSIDKQFHDEVSRDYATFLGRLGPSMDQVQELYELSPEGTRLANVEFLATELERLGTKEKAIPVWRFTQERQTQPRNRLEGHVRLAQLLMESGKTAEATVEFEKGLGLWSQVNCTDCNELQSRLRKFVIDWNRLQKKSPTPELLTAYESFLSVFTADTEMMFWAAELAKEIKIYDKSIALFQRFTEAMTAKLPNLKGKEKSDAETNIENALLNQIEVAEMSKDVNVQIAAYDRYLQFSVKGQRRVDVQYQKAYLTYKQEKYPEASEQLRAVALLTTKDSESIREQAADLSLDALAILKDDARLEIWATEYANKFPKKRSEFLAISRKSVLNQSAAQAQSNTDLNQAWITLNRIDIAGADDADKITYLKNRMILAEKLNKYADARNAAEALLRIPSLKAEDQELALSKKAWYAELAFDFSTAYEAGKKLKLTELKPDEKLLRTAMFAELADQSAKAHYEEYLKTTTNKDNARLVAARLVRESKAPLVELKKFEKVLSEDPNVLAQLSLEVYAKTRDQKLLASVVGNKTLASTSPGKELWRESFLKQIEPVAADLASQTIGTKTQGEISKGIKKRAATIEKLEALVGKSVESQDWIAQVVGLSLLGREIERFYAEVIALPIPAGLTPEEEGQYLQLLSQQASPYQVKAADIKAKINEFWTGNQVNKVTEQFSKLDGDLRSLYSTQLSTLAKVAPENEKNVLTAAISAPTVGAKAMPSLAELETARKDARENPLNREKLVRLSELERKMGHATMASYLEARALKVEEAKK